MPKIPPCTVLKPFRYTEKIITIYSFVGNDPYCHVSFINHLVVLQNSSIPCSWPPQKNCLPLLLPFVNPSISVLCIYFCYILCKFEKLKFSAFVRINTFRHVSEQLRSQSWSLLAMSVFPFFDQVSSTVFFFLVFHAFDLLTKTFLVLSIYWCFCTLGLLVPFPAFFLL